MSNICWRENSPFSVLDFGCGYGGLVEYLLQKERSKPWYKMLKYTGIDLTPEMIQHAAASYGNYGDFLVGTKAESLFDYILINGTLNLRLGQSEEYWTSYCMDTILDLNSQCTKGLSVSFLTNERDGFEPGNRVYYADPSIWLNFFITRVSRRITLLHDYGVPEFTILVRKAT
jgi:SAM-dependent methyltransferase